MGTEQYFEIHPEESVEINLKEIEVEDELSVSAQFDETIPTVQGEVKCGESPYNELLNEEACLVKQVVGPDVNVIDEVEDNTDALVETFGQEVQKNTTKEQKVNKFVKGKA